MKSDIKILVVDDEPLSLQLLRDILVLRGHYIVETCESGEEALDLLSHFTPDIILLDINLPGIDGYGVCREIRADKRYRFTKIIMVSGCVQVEERLKGYESGADDYIAKPFDNQELLAKVKVFAQLKNKEEVDQIKADLLALFTHETGTPLNGIMGCAELLANEPTLSEKNRELATMIIDAGRQLNRFMKNVVLLCRLKAGVELNFFPANITHHLKEIITNFQDKDAAQKVRFEMELEQDILVRADWRLIFDALKFVIDNAVKFSPENGVVTVSAKQEKNNCLISIADQGKGIAMDLQDSIFDEFAIKDVQHHKQGQGISLAIVRYIMDYHQGSIGVSSGEGQGTVFTLTLPLNEGKYSSRFE